MSNRKLLIYQTLPLISSIYARAGMTSEEKNRVLVSIRDDPERTQARAILARKILEDPDIPDIQLLYAKVKGE